MRTAACGILLLLFSVSLGASENFWNKHKNDKIRWRSWSEATLAEAKKRNLPIWIHDGFYGCQWCLVMAKESFQDADLALQLENRVIPVLVDKFLYPREDALWQRWAQVHNGSSGWPLNMLLTPDGFSFGASNYLSKERLQQFLSAGHSLWDKRPEEAKKRHKTVPGISPEADSFAPFFVHQLRLEELWEKKSPKLEKHLTDLVTSRLWDVVSGGFHRYATDAQGLEPHYEKMLNDNARLMSLYVRSAVSLNRPEFLQVARLTLAMLDRSFLSAEGVYGNALEANPRAYVRPEKCAADGRLLERAVEGGQGIHALELAWFHAPSVPKCWREWREKTKLGRDETELIYPNALMLRSLTDLARASGDESDWARARSFAEKFHTRFGKPRWKRVAGLASPLEPEDRAMLGDALAAEVATFLDAETFKLWQQQSREEFEGVPSHDPSWLSPEFLATRARQLLGQEYFVVIVSVEKDVPAAWRDWVKQNPMAWDRTWLGTTRKLKMLGLEVPKGTSSGNFKVRNSRWSKI